MFPDHGAVSMIHTENAEHYTWGDGCDGWHLVRRPGAGVIQERMPAGTAEVRHYHRQSWQFFYVLQGSLVIEIEGEVNVLGPRHGIEVLPGLCHQVVNRSDTDAEFLVISVPPIQDDRVVMDTAQSTTANVQDTGSEI